MRKFLIAVFALCWIPLLLSGQNAAREGWPEEKITGKWDQILLFQGLAGQTVFGENQWGFGMEFVSNYRIWPFLSAGAGTGINLFGVEENRRLVPLFGELRVFPFPQKKHQPFLVLDSGYAWAWKDKDSFYRSVEGGLRLHTALGMQWRTRPGWNFYSEFGYIRQESRTERNNFWWINLQDENFIRETSQMNRWMVRIGLGF